jgi:hypothetical protein
LLGSGFQLLTLPYLCIFKISFASATIFSQQQLTTIEHWESLVTGNYLFHGIVSSSTEAGDSRINRGGTM